MSSDGKPFCSIGSLRQNDISTIELNLLKKCFCYWNFAVFKIYGVQELGSVKEQSSLVTRCSSPFVSYQSCRA